MYKSKMINSINMSLFVPYPVELYFWEKSCDSYGVAEYLLEWNITYAYIFHTIFPFQYQNTKIKTFIIFQVKSE